MKKFNIILKMGEGDCMFVVWKRGEAGKGKDCTGVNSLSFLGFDLCCVAAVFFDTQRYRNSVLKIGF